MSEIIISRCSPPARPTGQDSGGGHNVHRTQPEAALQAVAQFLERLT